MATYKVRFPITGYVEVTVEAHTEAGAVDKAWDVEVDIDDIVEWEVPLSSAFGAIAKQVEDANV